MENRVELQRAGFILYFDEILVFILLLITISLKFFGTDKGIYFALTVKKIVSSVEK
jgi:hypothetical protein